MASSVPRQGFTNWKKSRYSDPDGNCVEVAKASTVGVRDTKQHGAGPVLEFNADAWAAFTKAVAEPGSTLTGGF